MAVYDFKTITGGGLRARSGSGPWRNTREDAFIEWDNANGIKFSPYEEGPMANMIVGTDTINVDGIAWSGTAADLVDKLISSFRKANSGSGGSGGDGLPSQTGQNGRYLTTSGTTASWATPPGGIEVSANKAGVNTATTPRLVYVTADESNNGDTSLYIHNGSMLKFLQTVAMLLIVFLLQAQTPQTSYIVASITQLKAYNGMANRVYVTETRTSYIISTKTADEANVYAGTGGKKWEKEVGKISADSTIDGATNKVLTAAERTKLSGIASGATANSTDAQLRDRSTHTGAQAISTISGLQPTLDSKYDSAATKLKIRDSLNVLRSLIASISGGSGGLTLAQLDSAFNANTFFAGNTKGTGDSLALVTANSLKLKRVAGSGPVTVTKTSDSLLTWGLNNLDSSKVTGLHTESYYNTKYAAYGSAGGTGTGLSYDTTTAFYFDTLSKRLVVKYGNVRRRFYADDSLTLGGGGGGGTAQNLLRYSEELDNNSVWFPGSITMTGNTTQAPDGTTTAETGEVTGDYGSLTQTVSVTPNTQYTFSFYAKRGTAPSMEYSVFNATASSDIVSRVNYYSLMNASTFTRISTTFTTPSGCTSIIVYPMRPLTQRGTVFLWGAQLNAGATAGTYTKTTASAIP